MLPQVLTSSLYRGNVYHRRVRPRRHELRYRQFSFYLDLDEIDQISRRCRLFSRNRFNLFSFHDRDFGVGSHESLRAFVLSELARAGITQVPAKIRLLCLPRMFGYAFNPLSVYYCFDRDDRLFATVHEVHNTFHERHSYALPARAEEDDTGIEWIHQSCDKAMYVSPFVPESMRYRFRLNSPGKRLVIAIQVHDADGLMMNASLAASACTLNDRQLLRCLVGYPLMTYKVTVGIHYEALKLWFKRVPWFKHRPRAAT